MKKKFPAVGDLVVMRHSPEATMFRVKEVNEEAKQVGLIDAEIEDKFPNQAIQWMPRSLPLFPSVGQLKAFNK